MSVLINGTNGLIQAYDYQVLTTGFSYTFAAGTQTLVINPAGTLAAGTITMPAAPSDGMTITFSSTKQITALTLNGNTGQTVVSGVSVLPANQSTTYIYRSTNTTWYPLSTVATNVPATPAGGSIITSGTAQVTTSGTSIDFTSIPTWVKRITVQLIGISTGGTSKFLIQLGTGAGPTYTNTGYLGALYNPNSFFGFTTGFQIGGGVAAGNYSGQVILTLQSSSTNTWVESSACMRNDVADGAFGSGSIALSATLTAVRITTVSGDTFDAGSINILYE